VLNSIDCHENGTCFDACLINPDHISTDIEYILPGTSEDGYGNCQRIYCKEDFTMVITKQVFLLKLPERSYFGALSIFNRKLLVELDFQKYFS
jgi:hypothetical protein